MAIAHVATMSIGVGSSPAGASASTGTTDTTGADFIIYPFAGDNTATPTDGKGNSLSFSTRYANGTATGIQLGYTTGGAPTVGTGHGGSISGGSFAAIGGLAFSGVASSPADQTNGSGGTGASPQSTGSITPSEDNCLVITAQGTYGTTPMTASPLTVSSSAAPGSFNDGIGFGYEIQTTATARNPSWTWSFSGFGDNGGRIVMSFKSAGAAGGGVNFLTLLGVG